MNCYSDCGCAGARDTEECIFNPSCSLCERTVADVLDLGTCQQCGRYTTDRYCFATDGCKELGGADVL